MRQEHWDSFIEFLKSLPGLVVTAMTWDFWVGLLTVIYLLLQIAYLIRKWVRNETAWGLKIKRGWDKLTTQPGDLHD